MSDDNDNVSGDDHFGWPIWIKIVNIWRQKREMMINWCRSRIPTLDQSYSLTHSHWWSWSLMHILYDGWGNTRLLGWVSLLFWSLLSGKISLFWICFCFSGQTSRTKRPQAGSNQRSSASCVLRGQYTERNVKTEGVIRCGITILDLFITFVYVFWELGKEFIKIYCFHTSYIEFNSGKNAYSEGDYFGRNEERFMRKQLL